MQSIEEGAHLLANHGEILEGERVVDVENDRVSLRIAARRLDRAKRTVGEGMRCIRFGGSGGGRGRRRGRVLRRGTARLEEGAQIDFFAVIVDFKLFRLEIRDCPPFFVEGNQWEGDEAAGCAARVLLSTAVSSAGWGVPDDAGLSAEVDLASEVAGGWLADSASLPVTILASARKR